MVSAIVAVALFAVLLAAGSQPAAGDEVLGCGGFIKSHANIDFSKVEVKLLTKQGSLKDTTDCSPANGYYFLPVYDKGDYVLRIAPPPGWSFEPQEIAIAFDGRTDRCSAGEDVNFTFKGFGITGSVENAPADRSAASGVSVELRSQDGHDVRTTSTDASGVFSFTPVVPGTYTIRVQRPNWHFRSAQSQVVVQTGNTELPAGTFVVSGYDVSGEFRLNGLTASTAKVSVALYSAKGVPFAGACSTQSSAPVSGNAAYEAQASCVSAVGEQGSYAFGALPNGRYLLRPIVSNSNVQLHIAPDALEFDVRSDTLRLSEPFEITGFSVDGRVRASANGFGIADATISVDGQHTTKTHTDGTYTLRNLRPGTFSIRAESSDVQFAELTVQLSLARAVLPDIVVSAFKVCGQVVSASAYTVALTKHASTFHTQTSSQPGTGEWCAFLPPGQFTVQVLTSDADRSAGIQFFPLQQNIDVKDSPVSGVLFSQLRATVSGTIRCLSDPDATCKDVTVTLLTLDTHGKPTGQRTTTTLQSADGAYRFDDVLPGLYEITVPSVYLCWSQSSQQINVKTAEERVPTFEHTGYLVSVISSHATTMILQLQPATEKTAEQRVALVPGLNTICTKAFGTYDVHFDGCHSYDSNELPSRIRIADHAPITVNAVRHRTGVRILSDVDSAASDGPVKQFGLRIEAKSWSKDVQLVREAQLVDGLFAYRYDFDLKPEEHVRLIPSSDVMLFAPADAELTGSHDCVANALSFRASLGLMVTGRIEPALAGAKITLRFVAPTERAPLETVTDAGGRFVFGPLAQNVRYALEASKESYVFGEFDRDTQTFGAHKLCEVIVSVRQSGDAAPMAGVLLSLSGGTEGYRKNLVTGDDGTIKFHSLSPGQYYLRPMLKEYRFEPTSKVIEISGGETVQAQVQGTRVAYSVLGAVRTLNGDPFGGATVEMRSLQPCAVHQEETASEPNGLYRIRGLKPGCRYALSVKRGGAVAVERTIPAERTVTVAAADVTDVYFVAVQPLAHVDVLARIRATSNEHYKTLRVQLYRQGAQDTPIYSQRVESPLNVKGRVNPGVMVFLPQVPFDGQSYVVEVSSSLSTATYRYELTAQTFVANRSLAYVEIEFAPEVRSLDGDLNQNSLSALLLIAVLAIGLFKQNLAFDFFSGLWTHSVALVERGLNEIGQRNGGRGSSRQRAVDAQISESEIEKLAQSINATKKKSRKV